MPAESPLAADLDSILQQTGDLWEEFRGQRLFLTGGTGFFGCWLLESLLWANDRLNLGVGVTVLTRHPQAFHRKAPHLAGHPAVTLHPGDIADFAFPAGRFSHVIHAATEASARLNEENPLLMYDTVVAGTRRALDFTVHCGAVKFLLTSSGAVYGRQPPELTHVPEDYPGAPSPFDPRAAYHHGKRAAEMLCLFYSRQHRFAAKIARGFAFVGPYLPLDIHFAIGNFIRDGLRGGPILVNGDGSPLRSYLYGADLAVWLWTILLRGQSCRPYNVGSGETYSIRQVADLVADCFVGSMPVMVACNPVVGRQPERYVPSVDRVTQELAVAELVGLPEALRRTVQFHTRPKR
jgi:dTDP-glucose 4,6-dehydratase